MYTPKYSITNKILKNIGIIEASREVIDHAPLLPFYEREFQKDALARAVHHGTHIEGNELNLNQAEKVMMGEVVAARERDIQEVINYRRVMDRIGQLTGSDSQLAIDEKFILELHKLTVEKILETTRVGVYRSTQVVVKNSLTGEVTFRPPLPIAVPIQISELLEFINNSGDMHPVLKSGTIHYELVRIHPFVDGNGRVSRALSTYILFQEGYDIRKFFSLEEYFDNDSASYYEALQSVGKAEGDLTTWLEYFTQGLAIELSKIKDKIERISVDATLKERLGGTPLLLSDRQLKIMEYIQKTGYLQNQAFQQLFPMVSEDTVLNEIKVLLKAGIIKKSGKTKGAKYIMANK
ncbi:MAG TPA: Fic family protein [Candidatus Limnocylindrales bacterium]|nr:Fic family protein [Candidatus Limnocylindrales bacterium]